MNKQKLLQAGILSMALVFAMTGVSCATTPSQALPRETASSESTPAATAQAAAESSVKFRRNVVSYNFYGDEHAEEISHMEVEWSQEEEIHWLADYAIGNISENAKPSDFYTLKLTIYQKNGRVGTLTFFGGTTEHSPFGEYMGWNTSGVGWSDLKAEGDILWWENSNPSVPYFPLFFNLSSNKLSFSQPGYDDEGEIVIELDGSFFSGPAVAATPAPANSAASVAATPAVRVAVVMPAKFRRSVVSYNLNGSEYAEEFSYMDIEWSQEKELHWANSEFLRTYNMKPSDFYTLKLTIYAKNGRVGTFTFFGGEGLFGKDMKWYANAGGWSDYEWTGDLLWLRVNGLFSVPSIFGVGTDLDRERSLNKLVFYDPHNDDQAVIELDGSFFAQ